MRGERWSKLGAGGCLCVRVCVIACIRAAVRDGPLQACFVLPLLTKAAVKKKGHKKKLGDIVSELLGASDQAGTKPLWRPRKDLRRGPACIAVNSNASVHTHKKPNIFFLNIILFKE